MTIILVTGGTRSGKSEWAEYLAKNQDKLVIYLATAQENPQDAEWQARINAHRLRRPSHWQTLPCPVKLGETLNNYPDNYCLLVDSLGTWVANELSKTEDDWTQTVREFIDILQKIKSTLIFVAEETGWGVVPAHETGRLFRDRLGNLIRQVGGIADQVYLVTGGYALDLTQLGQKLP